MTYSNRRLPSGFAAMMHSLLSATTRGGKKNLTCASQVTEMSKLPVFRNFRSKLQLAICQMSGCSLVLKVHLSSCCKRYTF